MPLTGFQEKVARLLATHRSADSYLAGGAAMHITPASKRYSNDLDYFRDSQERVASAFAADRASLQAAGVDLAVNKLLALVGREEPRDFLDIIYAHQSVLSLGALCWAAAGKDPGFTPTFLLSLLRRRGRYRPEDFARLHLREQPALVALKGTWLAALDQAEAFIAARPPDELGCLYYSKSRREFVSDFASGDPDIVPHFGRPGGVMPQVRD